MLIRQGTGVEFLGAAMTDRLDSGQPRPRRRDSTSQGDPIAEFCRTVARKLGRGGNDEDQLRGPVEILIRKIGAGIGLKTTSYGEVNLRELQARPDYAVDVGDQRVGYIELKAPGRNIPFSWRPTQRERVQWEKFCALPNLIYTDGTVWRRYIYGEPAGPAIRVAKSREDFRNPISSGGDRLKLMIRDFLLWEPEQPRSLADLIRIVAGLCQLLRDEVTAILTSTPDHAGYEDLALLAEDWRDLLFPDLDNLTFSDAYAQTVTFALLLARVNGVVFDDTPLNEIARQLGKKHSLIGKSLAVLTDGDGAEELTVIDTLRRVIGTVDWSAFDDSHTNVYIDLYERFLAEYDPTLRKKSGSYFTPEPVARFMVNFTDEILRRRLRRSSGFAADDVIVVDPAMGTGTFLIEVMRSVAETVGERQGIGARPARLRELFQKRLVGFERQVAPYAVAELRLHQALKTRFDTEIPRTDVRFLTDALENPKAQQERFTAAYRIIGRSRSEANRLKREARVMVVIGNPPHVENARGYAPWIEEHRKSGPQTSETLARPSMDEFRTLTGGRYESDLHALHWYFWRWALWKVFDAHADQPTGVVAFITPSSYTTGKAFAGMREYLRRTCDEGWIIDLSPEGNRSNQETRIFGDVQRGLCIGIFARYDRLARNKPAAIHRMSVAGERQEKFAHLQKINLEHHEWAECQTGWQQPFLPGQGTAWESYPGLSDLMPWSSRGVTTGRNWAYAPNPATLKNRWTEFMNANTTRRKALFKEARDRKLNTEVGPLPGFPSIKRTLAEETSGPLDPVQVGYRSFDRQWIIPDNRLMVVPRPPLWAVRSAEQIYVTEQSSHPINCGPAITFTANIPDIHHYNARSGRTMPLYRDNTGEIANFAPGLRLHLRNRLDIEVSEHDIIAYIAGIAAHPGYASRFKDELQQPGVHIPLTASRKLWQATAEVGRAVIWLHTYGARCSGHSLGVETFEDLVDKLGPKVLSPISDTAEEMPEHFEYDPNSLVLHIGSGTVGPVHPQVWQYEITGFRVMRKWLDYRMKRPRYKKVTSDLDLINCDRWTPQFTNELLELVTVLTACINLEERQDLLLAKIITGNLITTEDLESLSILPASVAATKPPEVLRPESSTLF